MICRRASTRVPAKTVSNFRDLVPIGGFPEDSAMEDVAFCEKLVRVTQPLLVPDPVITDSRKFKQMGVWRSLFRVWAIQIRHEMRLPIKERRFFSDIR